MELARATKKTEPQKRLAQNEIWNKEPPKTLEYFLLHETPQISRNIAPKFHRDIERNLQRFRHLAIFMTIIRIQ